MLSVQRRVMSSCATYKNIDGEGVLRRVHNSLSMHIEFTLEPVREHPHIMRIERLRIQSSIHFRRFECAFSLIQMCIN